MKAVAIDFNEPESARGVGADLATTSTSLTTRLALADETITELGSLEQAVLDRQAIGDAVKRVQEFFAPLKQMADKLHKALCQREHEILGPLLTLDRAKRNAISEYKDAQDLARMKRERAIADAQHVEQQSRAAAEAAALESAGDHEMAAGIIAEAIAAPAPIVVLADETKAVAGLKFTRRWLWRYTGGPKDTKGTPPDVVRRTMTMIPREFLCVDEKRVAAYARSMKASGRIPGIDIYHVDDPIR